jgi:hypothetical protein
MIYLPLANAFFFQIICPYFLILASLHIMMMYGISKYTLLRRAVKPSAIMGSEYSQQALNFLNFIFVFQGFGLLCFDVYFRDFKIATLLIFLYSLLQLVNFKNLIHKIKKKYIEHKNRKLRIRKSTNTLSSENDYISEGSNPNDNLVSLPSFIKFNDNLSKDKIYRMLNNSETPYKYLNRFFITDYDRLNPITKTQAIDNFNKVVNFATHKSKLQNYTKNMIMDGMMSTIMNKLNTGNKLQSLGLRSFDVLKSPKKLKDKNNNVDSQKDPFERVNSSDVKIKKIDKFIINFDNNSGK